MNTFVGQFYWVTEYSLYRVLVKDLVTTPEIRKMATRGGKQLGVPVGGTFRGGFYVGLTALGMFRYGIVRHQRTPLPNGPKRLEEVSRKRRGMHASEPIGIFLSRDAADDCYMKGSEESFDPLWRNQTAEALCTIGHDHPLVTISTEGELAIPRKYFVRAA